MDNEDYVTFVDDLTLLDIEGGRRDLKEAQADQWAEEALVPRVIWETSEAPESNAYERTEFVESAEGPFHHRCGEGSVRTEKLPIAVTIRRDRFGGGSVLRRESMG
jgi:hypothetical protein